MRWVRTRTGNGSERFSTGPWRASPNCWTPAMWRRCRPRSSAHWEELAARYLESRGYEIVERNYRCCEGEADLVVYDPSSEEVVLVEVKARRGHEPDCYPEEAVSRSKRRRYRRIAHQFIADHYPCPSIRFDVIAVSFDTVSVGEIRHLYGAFDWEAGQ